MDKVRVGITIGDVNGIGLEVIIKTLNNETMLQHCVPVIYGSSKVVSYHKNIAEANDFSFHSLQNAERLHQKKVNVLNCWQETVNINLGRATEDSGKYAHISLDRAVRDLREGLVDVLVTAPINKHAMQLARFNYAGHTEYLEDHFETQGSLMMMLEDQFRVALVTSHIPIAQVADSITKEHLMHKLDLLTHSLKTDFGLEKPLIAILGLNPHASDEGLMGTEEQEIIRPVIIEAKKKGHMVLGPYPSDGFFGAHSHRKFDAILAMYHDQGLIPFKTLAFQNGVNYTAGLPVVRTSPDHGTAYDIAGQNLADPGAFRAALYQAIDIFRSRKRHLAKT